MKRENLIGAKFYKLTIKEWNKDSCNWKCECECGKICFRSTAEFNRNRTKSCGCDYRNKPRRFAENISIKRRIINSYQSSARQRDISFNLSEKEFINLIEKDCYYCNQKPSSQFKGYKFKNEYLFNGIDRVDNSKGYTIENCVTCCKICNNSKKDLPLQIWKDWIKRIHSHIFKNEL